MMMETKLILETDFNLGTIERYELWSKNWKIYGGKTESDEWSLEDEGERIEGGIFYNILK